MYLIMTMRGLLTVPADGYLHTADGFGYQITTGAGLHIITEDGNIQNFTGGFGFPEEFGLQTGVCGDITIITSAGILVVQGFIGTIDTTTAIITT